MENELKSWFWDLNKTYCFHGLVNTFDVNAEFSVPKLSKRNHITSCPFYQSSTPPEIFNLNKEARKCSIHTELNSQHEIDEIESPFFSTIVIDPSLLEDYSPNLNQVKRSVYRTPLTSRKITENRSIHDSGTEYWTADERSHCVSSNDKSMPEMQPIELKLNDSNIDFPLYPTSKENEKKPSQSCLRSPNSSESSSHSDVIGTTVKYNLNRKCVLLSESDVSDEDIAIMAESSSENGSYILNHKSRGSLQCRTVPTCNFQKSDEFAEKNLLEEECEFDDCGVLQNFQSDNSESDFMYKESASSDDSFVVGDSEIEYESSQSSSSTIATFNKYNKENKDSNAKNRLKSNLTDAPETPKHKNRAKSTILNSFGKLNSEERPNSNINKVIFEISESKNRTKSNATDLVFKKRKNSKIDGLLDKYDADLSNAQMNNSKIISKNMEMLTGLSFQKSKKDLGYKYLTEFNEIVFEDRLKGLEIQWSSRMTRTAGYCECTREILPNGTCAQKAIIQLSTKVVDTEERLMHTLLHELCHAADWIIDMKHSGHGKNFKKWALKAKSHYPEFPTDRCHNYKISYKYNYECQGCHGVIGRHSKSIDSTNAVCNFCSGKFKLLPKLSQFGTEVAKQDPSGFSLYVKENFSRVKSILGKVSHGEVMRELSRQHKEANSEIVI